MAQHGIDPARVYVAGLSAGGAMAAILGEAYPDLYAAVGVHSGLAPGSARDLPSALAAMRSGATAASSGRPSPPTIVFHGDADTTVHPSNGEHVIHASTDAVAEVDRQRAAGGRDYTRHLHRSPGGTVLAEHWVVHGSGHAWSGGSREGSHTDPAGPDATQEMLRFFFAQRGHGHGHHGHGAHGGHGHGGSGWHSGSGGGRTGGMGAGRGGGGGGMGPGRGGGGGGRR